MSFSYTTNYSIPKPAVGTETDAWGDDYHTGMDIIDTRMKANADAAAAALTAAAAVMPANTIKGSILGGTPVNLTAAQVNTILGTTGGGGGGGSGVTAGSTPENPQTATYALLATDAGRMVTFNNGSTAFCRINSGVFAADARVEVISLGAGLVVFDGTATRRSYPSGSDRLKGRYAQATIWFVTASEYVLFGDVEPPTP